MGLRPTNLKAYLLNAETVELASGVGEGSFPGPPGHGIIPFNQRSLGYGDNAPLIVKDLPAINATTNSDSNFISEITNDFVRGGVQGLTNAAKDDRKRLGKLLLTPQGLAWQGAQVALAATNPRSVISPRNRLSNPLSALATAATGNEGIRFRKDGLLDLKFEQGYNYDPRRGGKKYEGEMLNIIDPSDSKKERTESDTLLGVYENIYNPTGLRKIGNFFRDLGERLNIPTQSNLKTYVGGAHSVFGIGQTRIKRYKSNPFNDIGNNGGYLPGFNSNLFALRQGPNPSKDASFLPITPNHTDYRSATGRPNNVTQTRIGLYKLGNPGLPHPETSNGAYNVPVPGALDELNANPIFRRGPEITTNPEVADYIKFRIAVVDTANPTIDNVIQFRAFLDSISDNYTGNWNSYKYNGRAEEFYTYAGFQRGITFNFKIHSQTRAEQQPLWNKLNYLVAQTAPEYKNNRMRGVFSRLTIGDWMNEIPGFFTSIGLNWSTAYPWEIQQDPEGLDSDVQQYPHILDVACTFQPVHNFAPSNSQTTPFIHNRIPAQILAPPFTPETAPEVDLNTLDTSFFNPIF